MRQQFFTRAFLRKTFFLGSCSSSCPWDRPEYGRAYDIAWTHNFLSEKREGRWKTKKKDILPNIRKEPPGGIENSASARQETTEERDGDQKNEKVEKMEERKKRKERAMKKG